MKGAAAVQLGDAIGPQRRRAPQAAQIAAYMGAGRFAEPLFVDEAYARALGFAGVIAPGPMLTAFLEQFVRGALPDWRLEALGTTFRVPTLAGSEVELRGAVTEHHEMADGERLVCDLVLSHTDGTAAVTGTARLCRRCAPAADEIARG